MKFTELTKEQQEHLLKMVHKWGEPPEGTTHVDIAEVEYYMWLRKSSVDMEFWNGDNNGWLSLEDIDQQVEHYYTLPEKPWYDPEDVKQLNIHTGGSIRIMNGVYTMDVAEQSTPERYQMFNNTLTEDSDLIDYWEATRTPEEFRQIILSNLDRYRTRYGQKDSCLTEAKKMRDYLNRLVAFEEKHHAGDEQEGVE